MWCYIVEIDHTKYAVENDLSYLLQQRICTLARLFMIDLLFGQQIPNQKHSSYHTFAEFERLATEGSLIDLAILSTREGNSIVFQFNDRMWGFSTPIHKAIDQIYVWRPCHII